MHLRFQGVEIGCKRAEVRAAMGEYRPVFKIGIREVYGVMREAMDYGSRR